MARIIKFPVRSTPKLGYTKARKTRKNKSESNGQLNLFTGKDAQIFTIPSRYTPFEQAFILDERNDPRAKDFYLKAIDEDDCPADAFCNLAIIESLQGNNTKAFNLFTQALKNDERHFETHYNLANLYFELDDLRLSQLHYEIAIEIQPDFPNSYFNLGLVYTMNEDYKKAIVTLCKYKGIVPKEEAMKAEELISLLKQSVK